MCEEAAVLTGGTDGSLESLKALLRAHYSKQGPHAPAGAGGMSDDDDDDEGGGEGPGCINTQNPAQ